MSYSKIREEMDMDSISDDLIWMKNIWDVTETFDFSLLSTVCDIAEMSFEARKATSQNC